MITYPRRLAPVLLATVAALAVLLGTPGVALAEGSGYDGRGDQLVLKWQHGKPQSPRAQRGPLLVFGRGFRGHSGVALRVGATVEKTALADATGTVRLRLDGAQPGTTIVAVGQTPSGSKWTLLGAVPSEAVARGPQTFVTPGLASLSTVALAMMLIRRRRPRRVRPTVGSARRTAGFSPRHRAGRRPRIAVEQL